MVPQLTSPSQNSAFYLVKHVKEINHKPKDIKGINAITTTTKNQLNELKKLNSNRENSSLITTNQSNTIVTRLKRRHTESISSLNENVSSSKKICLIENQVKQIKSSNNTTIFKINHNITTITTKTIDKPNGLIIENGQRRSTRIHNKKIMITNHNNNNDNNKNSIKINSEENRNLKTNSISKNKNKNKNHNNNDNNNKRNVHNKKTESLITIQIRKSQRNSTTKPTTTVAAATKLHKASNKNNNNNCNITNGKTQQKRINKTEKNDKSKIKSKSLSQKKEKLQKQQKQQKQKLQKQQKQQQNKQKNQTTIKTNKRKSDKNQVSITRNVECVHNLRPRRQKK